MTSAPRRDHEPGQFGRHDSVECRGCGSSLGTLARNNTLFLLGQNADAFVPIGTMRIDLVCKICGATRFLRGDRLRGMGIKGAA